MITNIITMKKTLLYLLFVLFNLSNANAQLTVIPQPYSIADSIIINQFITSGSGTISNVVIGSPFPNRFATFSGISNLGINNGIIISTGNTANIPNPASMQIDDVLTCGPNYSFNCPDAQLSILAGIGTSSINDVTNLEFDFQPATDTIRFQYVFGSEEYPEFVCAFNDVFGFFVTGTNPAGGSYSNKNFALIPGTNLPVSINSINPGVPGSAFGGTCTGNGQSLAYSNYYVANSGSTVIFDGLTTVLDITLPVVVLDTYHIKMGICNANDGIYESAVFLRDNTFGGNAPRIAIGAAPGITVSNDTVYACAGAVASFTSPKSVAYSWSTGQTTQSISLSAATTPQLISCTLSNPAVPAQYTMTPFYLVSNSSCSVGLDEVNVDAGIMLNFNSGDDALAIHSKNDLPAGTNVYIYNVSGSKVLSFQTNNDSRELNIPLHMSSGSYIAHIFNNRINLSKRFEKL